MQQQPFSQKIEIWLKSKSPKTIANLSLVFEEKSFALAILLLMFLPALPLPTGGVTHVFEIITMLLALEMIIGRHSIWLPKRWEQKQLNTTTQKKAIPFIVKRIQWFERFSRPRLSRLTQHRYFTRFAGLIVLALAIFAFIAPPFSGLDTLPALGAVMIALALILEDAVLFTIGCIVGIIGIGLIVGLSSAALQLIHHYF